MTDFDRTHCIVVPIDLIKPEDESVESPVFSIDVEVTFTTIPDDLDLCDDEDTDEEYESYTTRKTHVVELDRIVGESSHVSAVWDILEDMDVPVETNVVSLIVAAARDMARARKLRKVLRMGVVIDVVTAGDSEEEEDSGVSCGFAVGPADAAAVEKNLTVVEEIREGRECAICKEEIRVGTEAGRMPCSHVFHRTCVVQWLERSGSCPLCRSKFPSAN